MKKIFTLGIIFILLFTLAGCLDSNNLQKEDKLVLKNLKAIDATTLEAEFDDGSIVEITEFSPYPLEADKETEVTFTYKETVYSGKVTYNMAESEKYGTLTVAQPKDENNNEIAFSTITLNGAKRDSTGFTEKLLPGEYKLKIVKKGYTDFQQTITIETGKTTSIKPELSKNDNQSQTEVKVSTMPNSLSDTSTTSNLVLSRLNTQNTDSPWGSYQVIPQLSTNYNSWIEYNLDSLFDRLIILTEDTQTFTIDSKTYNVDYKNLEDNPTYDIKITFRYQDRDGIFGVFYRNIENTQVSYIRRSRSYYKSEKEIRQIKYEINGSEKHTKALYYRKDVDDMNDIVEIWEDDNQKKVKCVRVYNISQPDNQSILDFAAIVDSNSDDGKTTGRLYSNDGEIPDSPAIFNDNDKLKEAAQDGEIDIPDGYPEKDMVGEVYKSGVSTDDVENVEVDLTTLETNL